MAEYIEKEPIIEEMQSLIDNVSRNFPKATETELIILKGKYEAFMEYIKEQPKADVQPVKRGHWEKDEKGQFHHCSECEAETFRDVDSWGLDYGEYLSDFCPCCGADMREANATKG